MPAGWIWGFGPPLADWNFWFFGVFWGFLGIIFGGVVPFWAVRGVFLRTKCASVKMGNAKSVQKCGKTGHFCALSGTKLVKTRAFCVL